jgi:hypothetical protein
MSKPCTARHPSSIDSVGLLPWVLLVLLLIAAAPAVWAEPVSGNGQRASEARAPGPFDAVALGGGIALKIKQGSAVSVVVHGDSNLVPLVETAVEGSSLQVRWKRNTRVRTQLPLVVEVVAPHLQAVSSAGSGDIEIDTLKVPRLSLSIRGSSDLRAKDLSTESLSVGIAGSGDVKLAGQAVRMTIEVAGSGSVDAAELNSDEVTVGIAGSGDARVHASRRLVASIAGSGDVLYSGEPSVQRSIAGSGRVRRQ